MRNDGVSPLDDGSGEWLPFSIDNPALIPSSSDQRDILVHARLAASMVGATPRDRPEWITQGADGHLYCTLTNNTKRLEPNAANPSAPNPYGQIIRWQDSDGQTITRDCTLVVRRKDRGVVGS